MAKLDKIDLKLLTILEEDARLTLSQIAKKLKTSQQVVSYRLKSLEKRKIIGGYYTIINLTKLGYTNYRVMFRLSNIDKNKHKEITDFLIQHDSVLWIVDFGGRWDLLVNFTARNVIHFNKILHNFKTKFPQQIQNYDILTTIEVTYFGRDYFTKKSREIKHLPYFGREEEISIPDRTNLQILNLISENARMNSVEISQKINVSPNTVMLRLREMKKSGLIQGFKPLIYLENTSFSGYKALVKFQNITEHKEKEIINYLKTNVNVVAIVKLIGLWDFEIEFETETKEEMLELTRTFRDHFKDVINEFEVIPLFHEYKYNFFPRDLLESAATLSKKLTKL